MYYHTVGSRRSVSAPSCPRSPVSHLHVHSPDQRTCHCRPAAPAHPDRQGASPEATAAAHSDPSSRARCWSTDCPESVMAPRKRQSTTLRNMRDCPVVVVRRGGGGRPTTLLLSLPKKDILRSSILHQGDARSAWRLRALYDGDGGGSGGRGGGGMRRSLQRAEATNDGEGHGV